MTKQDRIFIFRLSADDAAKLAQLAVETDRSRASVLRRLLRRASA